MTREISIAFQTDKRASDYIALAKLVDTYDFDAISVYCDAPFHSSFPPLMLMAPHITRARISIAAISPFRIHPIDIASQTALLADVAQVDLSIGFARGAWLQDYGIHEPAKPVTAIREAIEVVKYLLNGDTGGYSGEIFSLADHITAPYPLPDKMPSILVGTWGRKLCEIAGKLADEVKIGGSANPDVISVIQDYIHTGTDKAGRSRDAVDICIGAVSVLDEDRDAARATAKREVALYLPVVAALDPTVDIDPNLAQRIQTCINQKDTDGAAALISDDLLAKFAFAGNPDDMIEHCERLFATGASRVEFGTPHGIQSETGIRLLGEKVIPAFQE